MCIQSCLRVPGVASAFCTEHRGSLAPLGLAFLPPEERNLSFYLAFKTWIFLTFSTQWWESDLRDIHAVSCLPTWSCDRVVVLVGFSPGNLGPDSKVG